MTSLAEMIKSLIKCPLLSHDEHHFIQEMSDSTSHGDFIYEIRDNDLEKIKDLYVEYISNGIH